MEAESVSAYVAAAVGHKLDRDRDRDRALARWRQVYAERGVEPGAEHHAWARQVLGISVDDDTRTEA